MWVPGMLTGMDARRSGAAVERVKWCTNTHTGLIAENVRNGFVSFRQTISETTNAAATAAADGSSKIVTIIVIAV